MAYAPSRAPLRGPLASCRAARSTSQLPPARAEIGDTLRRAKAAGVPSRMAARFDELVGRLPH